MHRFECSIPSAFHAYFLLLCHSGTNPSDQKRYPDRPYQLDWIRHYLGCKAEQNGGSPDDVTERDVEKFYVKVNKFALVRHNVNLRLQAVNGQFSDEM